MILRTRQGDVELRSQEWGNESFIPPPGLNWMSNAGMPVTEAAAMGLPAVSNVIRSPAEIIASLPFMTYRGTPRERAENTWQWQVLHDQPDFQGTGTYTFFYDLALSLEAAQNAFLQKIKGTVRNQRRVMALEVLDPQRVRVYRDRQTGDKLFDVYNGPDQQSKGLTSDDILHVRGYARPGQVAGVPLLQLHRDAIGSAIALQGFEGDFFRNDAQPPFWFTGAKNQTHATEILAFHNSQHQGVGRRWKAGALWGDTMDVKTIPIAMRDAQYAEIKQLSVEDACRIWRWPKELLELSLAERPPADENAWTARMMKFYLLPRLSRIECAFAADPDLYQGSGLIGEFLTAALERADFVTRVRGYKDARQGGWITANEVRDLENYPPRDDGDALLVTPTGSAPNPDSTPSPDPAAVNNTGNGHDRAAAYALIEEMTA